MTDYLTLKSRMRRSDKKTWSTFAICRKKANCSTPSERAHAAANEIATTTENWKYVDNEINVGSIDKDAEKEE